MRVRVIFLLCGSGAAAVAVAGDSEEGREGVEEGGGEALAVEDESPFGQCMVDGGGEGRVERRLLAWLICVQ